MAKKKKKAKQVVKAKKLPKKNAAKKPTKKLKPIPDLVKDKWVAFDTIRGSVGAIDGLKVYGSTDFSSPAVVVHNSKSEAADWIKNTKNLAGEQDWIDWVPRKLKDFAEMDYSVNSRGEIAAKAVAIGEGISLKAFITGCRDAHKTHAKQIKQEIKDSQKELVDHEKAVARFNAGLAKYGK